jgi:hypothetical protein
MGNEPAPVRVQRTEDEDTLMGSCGCGGAWRLRSNAVAAVTGRWHDRLGVVCEVCGNPRKFVFDITEFFVSRPGIWTASHRG